MKKKYIPLIAIMYCYTVCTINADALTQPVEHKTQEENPQKKIPIVKTRIVTIKNAISPEMTKYRFWGTYYSPSKFYLSINNKIIQYNESISCPIDSNNSIDITYHYEFKNGMVSGSKCVEFEIPEHASTIAITFSWNNNHRLISSSGRAINSKHGTMKSTHKII